ncbi:pre-rRNA-processing protein TSR2, putative [Babesia caballi]|uniref:Pre-rRNA-processing protein TSR2, putative n=1 Tax=Babesia caballi TaxID=5871 RepID=A0AAV4LP93_BABCB|nr:pre-rRNA-processing protein TSR2, putative [Babesia caballi]
MIDLLAVVCVRILLQAGVQAIAPRLPFFITRNARDVVEYLALDDALRLRFFDGEIPLVFPLTWFVQQIAPELPAVTITKSLILAADIIAAVFWYFSIRMIQELGLNRNDDVEGYSFVGVFAVVRRSALPAQSLLGEHIKWPNEDAQVLYNYVCNADGMLCFWVSFAVFAALNVSVPRAPDFIPYIIYQVAASGLVINGSFKMYAVLPALAMVAAQKRLRDDVAALTSWRQLKHVLSFLFPHIFVTLTIVVFYFTMHNESVLKRAFEVEYTGRGSGINYSLYWYPHRILPTEFTDINLLKSHTTDGVPDRHVGNRTHSAPQPVGAETLVHDLPSRNSLPAAGQVRSFHKAGDGGGRGALHLHGGPRQLGGKQLCQCQPPLRDTDGRIHHAIYFSTFAFCFVQPPKAFETMSDAVEAFRAACRSVMGCWTALNLAVENGWGGDQSAQKREELIALVIDFCLSKKQLYTDEVEDLLLDRMQTLFCVDIEDESDVEIARLLVRLHNTCSAGDLSFASELCQKLTKCDSTSCRAEDVVEEASSSESDGEGSGDDMVDGEGGVNSAVRSGTKAQGARARQPKTEELDDGWTKVL